MNRSNRPQPSAILNVVMSKFAQPSVDDGSVYRLRSSMSGFLVLRLLLAEQRRGFRVRPDGILRVAPYNRNAVGML